MDALVSVISLYNSKFVNIKDITEIVFYFMECCCEQGNSQSGTTKLNHKQQRKFICGFEVCLRSLYCIVVVQYTIDLSESNQSLQGFLDSHFNMLVLEVLA